MTNYNWDGIVYECYTESGKRFYASGLYSDIAIRKVEEQSKEKVSCWFICSRMPDSSVTIL
jgi:hypothetical protein